MSYSDDHEYLLNSTARELINYPFFATAFCLLLISEYDDNDDKNDDDDGE